MKTNYEVLLDRPRILVDFNAMVDTRLQMPQVAAPRSFALS